jgi:hypothetical protein
MLVSLSSPVCADNCGCTLGPGAAMAITAFFMNVGAGTLTFYLNKKLQTNQLSVPNIISIKYEEHVGVQWKKVKPEKGRTLSMSLCSRKNSIYIPFFPLM